jgi:hypothetical protein
MDLLNVSGNQQLDKADFSYLSQDQAVAVSADLVNGFAFSASSPNKLQVLGGFAPSAATSAGGVKTITVTNGAAMLSWRRGPDVLSGILLTQNALPTSQTLDITNLAPASGSATFGIFIRFNYVAGLQASRTFWNYDNQGFNYAQTTPTRLLAQWELRVESASPGAEYLQIGNITLPSMALVDTRTFYFEGATQNGAAAPNTWGLITGTDRLPDRATYGVRDLHAFVRAMKTCIEDIKGPGLQRWYDSQIGGMNVGFGPNTPALGRVAFGDANSYVQGPTPTSPSTVQWVLDRSADGTAFEGFALTRNQKLVYRQKSGLAALCVSQYGTVGIGPASEQSLFTTPNRSLMEVVTSVSGQTSLRIAPQAVSGTTPVGVDATLSIVAPDQSGNRAQMVFARGGAQGPETTMFSLGKGVDNKLSLADTLRGVNVMLYDPAAAKVSFGANEVNLMDTGQNFAFLQYTTAAYNGYSPVLNLLTQVPTGQSALLRVSADIQGNNLAMNSISSNGGVTAAGVVTASEGVFSTKHSISNPPANLSSRNGSNPIVAWGQVSLNSGFTAQIGYNIGSISQPKIGTISIYFSAPAAQYVAVFSSVGADPGSTIGYTVTSKTSTILTVAMTDKTGTPINPSGFMFICVGEP